MGGGLQLGLLAGAMLAPLQPVAAQAGPVTGDAPPPVSAPAPSGNRTFTPADFARFAPKTALDMLSQVPGFTIRGVDSANRGLGQASGNVLLNGERISGKSTDPETALLAIPAGDVTRIELVDAATLDVPGLTGQIANVFYQAKAKLSGQFSYRPEFRAHYADPLFVRGDVSVSGRRGPIDFTVSLGNNASRSAAGGPTLITRADSTLFETRDDAWTSNFDQPQVSGQFKIDGPGSSVANLNLLGRYFNSRYDETSLRDRVTGADQVRRLTQREKGYNYEIGGDLDFSLLGGRMKLIALNRFSQEPFTQTARTSLSDLSPDFGSRFTQDGESRETIGRAEYNLKFGRTDVQFSGEAAYNSLDSVRRLFALDPSGDFLELSFPGGTGRVSEDRYEGLVTIGRPLSSRITAQLVAGGEYSILEQQGAGGQRRTFFRPKGSLNLAAQFTPTFSANLKIIRRVEQLNFGDFLARVFLDNENANAGNPDLVPQQQWRIELELAKDMGSYGKTRLNLVAGLSEDFVDIIPVGATGESPGNIPRAQAYAFDLSGTLLFDPLGLKGAKLDYRGLIQLSSIEDPLTGVKRVRSGFTDRLLELNFRHDIPATDWAYGSNLNYSRVTRSVRLNEVFRQYEGPIWLGLFAEHKDVFGLVVRGSVSNLLNARSRLDRTVYTGRRNVAPIDFIERRDRLIGPIFSASLRGTF